MDVVKGGRRGVFSASGVVDSHAIDRNRSISLSPSSSLSLSLSLSLSPSVSHVVSLSLSFSLSLSLSLSLLHGARSFSLLPLSVLGSCHGAFAPRTFARAEGSRASMHLPTYISWV